MGDIIFQYDFLKKLFQLTGFAWYPLPPKSVEVRQNHSGGHRQQIQSFSLVKIPVFSWYSLHFFKNNVFFFTMAFTLDHLKNLPEKKLYEFFTAIKNESCRLYVFLYHHNSMHRTLSSLVYKAKTHWSQTFW